MSGALHTSTLDMTRVRHIGWQKAGMMQQGKATPSKVLPRTPRACQRPGAKLLSKDPLIQAAGAPYVYATITIAVAATVAGNQDIVSRLTLVSKI
jgi:hypothetical protein